MRVPLDGVEIVEKLLNFIFLLGKIGLEFEEGSVPEPTVEHLAIGKLPLLQVLALLLGIFVIPVADGFADVLPLNHILLIEFDNQVGAVGRLHFYLLDGFYLDRRFG